MIDVGARVEAGLAGAFAERGFDDGDVGAVDLPVAVDVSGRQPDGGSRVGDGLDPRLPAMSRADVEVVNMSDVTGEPCLSGRGLGLPGV